jgi:single-stranded-DNA-specific exonuclease
MRPAPRRWRIATEPAVPGLDPVLGRVLAARGHGADAAASLLDQTSNAHDPFLLPGMRDAVAVVRSAVQQGHRIAVYGDYDADGVTACAMLTRVLRRAGADALPYIPNRMSEGYGLHAAAVEELAQQGARCVITVDCGTSSVAAAASRPRNMAMVVTDHHLPLAPDGAVPTLAPVDALINPKLADSRYPFDGLAGAGVALKLVQGLEEAGVVPPGSAESSLALAALGTIADMMPLKGENRSIVRAGLGPLEGELGIRVLCDVAGITAPLRSSDVAFGLGPRINAAGRMEDARLALRLCLAEDEEEARAVAVELDEQNRRRQQAVSQALAEAEAEVASLDDATPAIVVGSPGWPMGIVGLVAGRLAERYARPAFVVCLDPLESKGSARSACGVHVVRALDGAAPALLRYGGHAMAAGFSLEEQRFAELRSLLCSAVERQLGDTPRERVHAIDCEISAAEATPGVCRALARLEPCGQGFPQPLLAVRGARVLSTTAFGADSQHLRVALWAGTGVLETIAFHKPNVAQHLPRGRLIDACFALELGTWDGLDRVRGHLRDVRPALPPPTAAEFLLPHDSVGASVGA